MSADGSRSRLSLASFIGSRRPGIQLRQGARSSPSLAENAKPGPSVDVYVARSFAHYLWTWLEDAGREYGALIAPVA